MRAAKWSKWLPVGLVCLAAAVAELSDSAASSRPFVAGTGGSRLIAFLPFNGSYDPDLHVVDIESGRVRRLTRGAKVVGGFAWSLDGRRIAYTRCVLDARPSDRTCDLFVMNADGTRKRRLTRTPLVRETDPVWSPNGQKVAALAWPYTYLVADVASGRVRKSRGRASASGLAWSPDSRRISFGIEGSRATELHVVNTDGSGGRRVVRNGVKPAWSPDGRTIAFERCMRTDTTGFCGARDIYVVNAGGEGVRALTRTPRRDERDIRWSPDGRRISFVDWRSGTTFYVMDAVAGSPARPLLHGATDPSWSIEWTRIAFLSCEPNSGINCTLNLARRDGSGARLVLGRRVVSFAWQGTAATAWPPGAASG
jgi:Tol biopolymer transport system component